MQNFTVEKYNSPIQTGAIHGYKNWTITANEVRLNYGVGIKARDDSEIVRRHDDTKAPISLNVRRTTVSAASAR